MNADCASSAQIQSCANHNCVTDGRPRFTLKWTGSGDLDLRVRTPGGVLIYYLNLYDATSGGVLEGDVVPSKLGYYAENIYFPDGPGWNVLVWCFGENEKWELDIYVGNKMIKQQHGTGLSDDFPFFYGAYNATGLCCSAKDCGSDAFDCINQNCDIQGSLRFTLIWEGSNDKDLLVITPGGAVIDQNPFDQVTGGMLDRDVHPKEPGRWLQNIIFPAFSAITQGTYQYQVNSNGLEVWIVEIVLHGELVTTTTGLTDSFRLTCRHNELYSVIASQTKLLMLHCCKSYVF